MSRTLLAAAAAVVLSAPPAWAGFVTLDVPGSTFTAATGIDGRLVVGNYGSGPGTGGGFVYDRQTGRYTLIADVLGSRPSFTGIHGRSVIGTVPGAVAGLHQSFVYDLDTGTATPFGPAGATGVTVEGVDGGRIVGSYTTASPPPPPPPGLPPFPFFPPMTGFTYDRATGTYTDLPLFDGQPVQPYGVDGELVVGTFGGLFGDGAFVFDGAGYSVIPPVNPDTDAFLTPSGVSGQRVVGSYLQVDLNTFEIVDRGFLYDRQTGEISPYDVPGATGTRILDVDGSQFVGGYESGGRTFGFVATAVPEPASVVLLGASGIGLAAARRLRRGG